MSEIVLWMGRVLKVLPEIISLWTALDAKDEPQTLDAILTLRRKISDEQMRESLTGDP